MHWPFVRNVVRLEVAASTNDLAKQLALQGREDLPLLVWADRQTRGRGRGDHAWWSDAGSLTFSLLLDPQAHGLRPEHEPRLALATAVAVINALEAEYGASGLGIRWPNDVEAAGQKLGGLLPERVETESGPRLVIGVGLNVHTRLDDAPSEVRRMAVSLGELLSARCEIEAVLRAVLTRIPAAFERLSRDDPSLPARWAGLDTLLGRHVRVQLGPRVVTGVGQGIDGEGALLLRAGTGTLRVFGGQVLRDA